MCNLFSTCVDASWLPWLLDQAAQRGLDPLGVERVAGAWTESEPRVERHTTAGLQGTSVAVGVRDPDAPDGGILILPGPLGEPASWRTLLLEALVLADVAEPLAAK